MMDPDHQSLDPDPELESPDIPKRVEIRLRSRIQGRNRNTSSGHAPIIKLICVVILSYWNSLLLIGRRRREADCWPQVDIRVPRDTTAS